ncbi:MAG TPA: enoyl-CoA hydratase [Vicinamibacterales bacterium]|nr:enoyl-CoA hydratase [Vicinamibacterales bacterium]
MSSDTTAQALEPFVLAAREGGAATLTLNRPERFNPLSMAMIRAMQTELDAIAADRSVHVVVLAARGRGFCAGHDLKEMRSRTSDEAWQRRLFDECSRMMMSLTRLPQPVIARVHGIATAAGCQLVSMCDLAIAAETATFAMPGVGIGLFCSTPAVGVARNIGRKRAMQMLLTAEPIDAQTACAWGLVNQVVSPDALDDCVRQWASRILSRSPAAIRIGKQTFYSQLEQPIDAAYVTASQAMACNALVEDAAEGIDAFLEKRPPAWSSR